MLTAFSTHHFSDVMLDRFSSDIRRAFDRLMGKTGVAMLDGVFVTATLAASANSVNHKLGHTPLGWIVTRQSAPAHVYESSAAPFTTTTIALTASAQVTVTLWVF
jgi:hypothetical protein